MKTVINKIINVDKKILIFLIIICIIGIITGSIFMTILSYNDKNSIIDSLSNFMSEYSHLNSKKELINNLIINFMYIFIIWIAGISIIGIPIVIFILFIKSFLISFTISSFIMKYKTKGLILGIIYNMPHFIVNLIVYLYLGVYSIKLSLFIIDVLIHKKTINFKNILNRYLVIFIFSIIIIFISTIYETYLMPILLAKTINILHL